MKGMRAVCLLFGVVLLLGCSRVEEPTVTEPPLPPIEATEEAQSLARLHSSQPQSGHQSHTYGDVPGWYLVSAPVSVGTGAFPGDVFRWYGKYEIEIHLDPSRGYWAWLEPNRTVWVDGGWPDTIEDLRVGWNMISVLKFTPRSELIFERFGQFKKWHEAIHSGWLVPFVYGYQASTGNQYHVVEVLDPWYGYWVKTLVPGVRLYLPGTM